MFKEDLELALEATNHFDPSQLPERLWFGFHPRDNGKTIALRFNVSTRGEVKRVREAFPATVWKRTQETASSPVKWLHTATYKTEDAHPNLTVEIRTKDAPKGCTPIYETVVKEEKVPVRHETRQVEKRVITGYECD